MKNGKQVIDTITDILTKSDKLCTDHNILKYLRGLSYQETEKLFREHTSIHSSEYLVYLDEMAKSENI